MKIQVRILKKYKNFCVRDAEGGRPQGAVRSTVAKRSPKQPDPSGGKSASEGHAQKQKMPN